MSWNTFASTPSIWGFVAENFDKIIIIMDFLISQDERGRHESVHWIHNVVSTNIKIKIYKLFEEAAQQLVLSHLKAAILYLDTYGRINDLKNMNCETISIKLQIK
jgi:hypothetical protein